VRPPRTSSRSSRATSSATPSAGKVISPADAQHRLDAQRDEIEALTKALASAHRLNASQATQIKNLKEERAEDACEDPKLVRDLIVFHYARFGRKRTPGKIPLSGLDAVIVRWLLDQADFTPRDVALMSVGFAENDFYREKGMVSLMNCATTKVDGKRVKDSEKAWRFREAGAKLRGESMTRAESYVPLSIRSRSKVATWLWRHDRYRLLSYETGRRLARFLP
jgi:hypothetical protein